MPELRIDPVCGRRVFVAEDRAGRPNDFLDIAAKPTSGCRAEVTAADCPFCAGHESATPAASEVALDEAGDWLVRVVPNKYPAVTLDGRGGELGLPSSAFGAHEVIIESPRHLVDWLELDLDQLARVLVTIRDRLRHWTADGRLKHALVFKNEGQAAGASLEHVHSQLIALPFVPDAVQIELDGAGRFFGQFGRCVFCDLLETEVTSGDRLVSNEIGYVALCAYAGRQPYETWLLPARHLPRFQDLEEREMRPLAACMQAVLRRLQAQVTPWEYNLILHTGPLDGSHSASYHWHWELIPRTTQLAGLEWGGGTYINPLSPERAAERLRQLSP